MRAFISEDLKLRISGFGFVHKFSELSMELIILLGFFSCVSIEFPTQFLEFFSHFL